LVFWLISASFSRNHGSRSASSGRLLSWRTARRSSALRPRIPASHGLDGVENQVEDHLLQLDPIAVHGRRALGEFGPHRDAVPDRFASGELDHLADRSIDVHAIARRRRLLGEIANALDHLACPGAVPDDASEGLLCLLQIQRVAAEPA
jgi:hypothetical protein